MIFSMRKFLRKRKALVLEMTRRNRKPNTNVTTTRKQPKETVFYMVRTVDILVTTVILSNVLLRKLKILEAKRNPRKKRSFIPCLWNLLLQQSKT